MCQATTPICSMQKMQVRYQYTSFGSPRLWSAPPLRMLTCKIYRRIKRWKNWESKIGQDWIVAHLLTSLDCHYHCCHYHCFAIFFGKDSPRISDNQPGDLSFRWRQQHGWRWATGLDNALSCLSSTWNNVCRWTKPEQYVCCLVELWYSPCPVLSYPSGPIPYPILIPILIRIRILSYPNLSYLIWSYLFVSMSQLLMPKYHTVTYLVKRGHNLPLCWGSYFWFTKTSSSWHGHYVSLYCMLLPPRFGITVLQVQAETDAIHPLPTLLGSTPLPSLLSSAPLYGKRGPQCVSFRDVAFRSTFCLDFKNNSYKHLTVYICILLYYI